LGSIVGATPLPPGASAVTKYLVFAGTALATLFGALSPWLPMHVVEIGVAVGGALIGIGMLYHADFDHA
jgi:hypothetical protein